jgi:hypothetical protein
MSDPLDIPIEELEVSVRLRGGMQANNCKTLRDVVTMTEADWMRTPNIGKTSVRELSFMLASMGLELGRTIARDGTLPLPFPSLHERLTRIDQRLALIECRLDALEHAIKHPMLREVGDMSAFQPVAETG